MRQTEAAPAVAPLSGDALLHAVTASMVDLHVRYHHRAPSTAKTTMLGDDLLACVLGGVYTDVEKTMIELQQSAVVQDTRNAFRVAIQHKFTRRVEELTGRRVRDFVPNNHVGPDLEIGLFLLEAQD